MNIRRIVTETGPDGRAIISSDDGERAVISFPSLPGFEITRIWTTDRTPPDQDGGDLTLQPWELEPPLGGMNWQIISRPPEPPVMTSASAAGASQTAMHPGGMSGLGVRTSLHRTDSLDLIIILSGEIWLEVGGSELHLRANDCVVQRGTEHAWRNRGTETCVMLALMVSTRTAAKP